jgi:hypothetical protein
MGINPGADGIIEALEKITPKNKIYGDVNTSR